MRRDQTSLGRTLDLLERIVGAWWRSLETRLPRRSDEKKTQRNKVDRSLNKCLFRDITSVTVIAVRHLKVKFVQMSRQAINRIPP